MSSSPAEAPAAPRTLAAGLAHHVNNALAVVIGRLELALREAPPGSPLSGHLEAGLECAERVAAAVRHVVALAIAAGGPAAPAVVSLRLLADQAARRAPGALSVEPGEADGPVLASKPLLGLVVDELIASARGPAGGPVVLRCWDDGDRCCLTVVGAGPDLSADAGGRLSEPFVTARGAGHLGLGLALCRDLAEAQGGDLRIAPAGGGGTAVTLSFPAAHPSL